MRNYLIFALMGCALSLPAQHLRIIHTNDTHSQIDPTEAPENLGGVMRRMAIIDSIRSSKGPEVMVVDAGDAVQGSLFFTLFGGEVEQKLMNAIGYDIQILGNHEFDNGMERLAENYREATPILLSTNYNLSSTPLRGLFNPWAVREVDGRKVGFIAINTNPDGLIDASNWTGLVYLDPFDAANATAWYLKNIEGVDRVVAITHIGYDDPEDVNDIELARKTKNIDLIIGGHSHTRVEPGSAGSRVINAAGDTVAIVQTGSKGRWLGEADIDLATGRVTERLHRIDSRLDGYTNPAIAAVIEPYRHAVDSVSSIVIGRSSRKFAQDSPALLNLLSDYVREKGAEICGTPVDLAIMNKGGIRNSIQKGKVTKGTIMNMLPFDNRIVVLDLKGSDLLDNLGVMARLQKGNGVSDGVSVTFAPDGSIVSASLNGHAIDAEKTYRVATISYLARGGDHMTPLTRGKLVASSDKIIFEDLIDSFEHGSLHRRTLKGDDTVRMAPAK